MVPSISMLVKFWLALLADTKLHCVTVRASLVDLLVVVDVVDTSGAVAASARTLFVAGDAVARLHIEEASHPRAFGRGGADLGQPARAAAAASNPGDFQRAFQEYIAGVGIAQTVGFAGLLNQVPGLRPESNLVDVVV